MIGSSLLPGGQGSCQEREAPGGEGMEQGPHLDAGGTQQDQPGTAATPQERQL